MPKCPISSVLVALRPVAGAGRRVINEVTADIAQNSQPHTADGGQ